MRETRRRRSPSPPGHCGKGRDGFEPSGISGDLPAAAGGVPAAGHVGSHLYGPPPGTSPAYWQVAAYSNKPLQGPDHARGVRLLEPRGQRQQCAVEGQAAAFRRESSLEEGWDVIKVNRNNLHERNWNVSGPKHVADLQERARKARSDGYRRVILGGQSYGGAISLEAASIAGHCGRRDRNRAGPRLRRLRQGLRNRAARRHSSAPVEGGARKEQDAAHRAHGRRRGRVRRIQPASCLLPRDAAGLRFELRLPGRHHAHPRTFRRQHQPVRQMVRPVPRRFPGCRRRAEGRRNGMSARRARFPPTCCPNGYRPPADGGPGSLLGAWSGSYSTGKRGLRNLCLSDRQGNCRRLQGRGCVRRGQPAESLDGYNSAVFQR